MQPKNIRRKKFADALLTGKASTYADASRIAGFNEEYGKKIVNAPDIQGYLLTKMAEKGITDDYAAIKMKEGMEAMAPPRKDGGQQYEDYFVRKQYLDMYFRLRGDYAPEKSERIEKHIVINVGQDFIKALRDTDAISESEAKVVEGELLGTTE